MMQGFVQANGYGVYSELRDFGRTVNIWVMQSRDISGTGKDTLLRFDENDVTYVVIEEGERLPLVPSFSVPSSVVESMLQALQMTVGDRLPAESKLQGKLEATERHLDDMRRLLFAAHSVDSTNLKS